MRGIAQANFAQIAAGRLAVSKARSRAVREYGGRMVKEHTRLQADAGELRSAKGVPLPTRPDEAQEAVVRDLERLPRERFDRAYLEHSVASHEAALRLFERADARAQDPVLAGYAQRALPHVRRHLDLARRTLARLTPP